MSGNQSKQPNNQIEAKFSLESKFDYIDLHLRFIGNVLTTTSESRALEECIFAGSACNEVEFDVSFSSVYCAFTDFINFLEAITTQVQECAFHWDAEGPDGSFTWHRQYRNDSGRLSVTWLERGAFRHQVEIETKQAVRVLYKAFRDFVESDDYDPIRYEEIKPGDAFALLLEGNTIAELEETLLQLNATEAARLIWALEVVFYQRHSSGPKSRHSLAYYVQQSKNPETDTDYDSARWFDPAWNSWSPEQRRNHVQNIYWVGGMFSWCGANLREMKSPLIEKWIQEN